MLSERVWAAAVVAVLVSRSSRRSPTPHPRWARPLTTVVAFVAGLVVWTLAEPVIGALLWGG